MAINNLKVQRKIKQAKLAYSTCVAMSKKKNLKRSEKIQNFINKQHGTFFVDREKSTITERKCSYIGTIDNVDCFEVITEVRSMGGDIISTDIKTMDIDGKIIYTEQHNNPKTR